MRAGRSSSRTRTTRSPATTSSRRKPARSTSRTTTPTSARRSRTTRSTSPSTTRSSRTSSRAPDAAGALQGESDAEREDLGMIDLIEAIAEPLVDAFRRPITYLRVSVTDRCNLRCVYCMPEAGLAWIPKPEILSYEEIVRIVEAGASVGVRSIRLTGGEPLVRRDLAHLVELLARIPGIDDIALS